MFILLIVSSIVYLQKKLRPLSRPLGSVNSDNAKTVNTTSSKALTGLELYDTVNKEERISVGKDL